MFMMDMQGTADRATASRSSRNPRCAVLGLLHREGDKVECRGVHGVGGGSRKAARQLPRIDLHEAVASPHRQPHPLAFPVDEIGLFRQADEGRGMGLRRRA